MIFRVSAVAGLEGGARGTHPLKIWSTMFLSHFVWKCFNRNKAQIARESIKNPESFQGSLVGPGPLP